MDELGVIATEPTAAGAENVDSAAEVIVKSSSKNRRLRRDSEDDMGMSRIGAWEGPNETELEMMEGLRFLVSLPLAGTLQTEGRRKAITSNCISL